MNADNFKTPKKLLKLQTEHRFEKILSQNLIQNSDLEKQFDDFKTTSTNSSSIGEDYDYLKASPLNSSFEKLSIYDRKYSSQIPSSTKETTFLNPPNSERAIRISYMDKLKNKGLFEKNEEKKFNNIFIFDWDDTLLCTSSLSPYGFFDENMIVPPEKLKKINKLQKYVRTILEKALEKGDTYIITNSEQGWVEYSCHRFFPDNCDLLDKIKILSARELYAQKYPKECKKWKINTFNDILKEYTGKVHLPTNIICVGDSIHEIEAGHALASKFPISYIKAIKFKQTPKIEDLIMQLSLVIDKFNYIYSTCKNWTIKVEKKKKANCDK